MNRLDKVFKKNKKRVLNIYCTAGYPHINSTTDVLLALQECKVDIIELGIPYSDPLADGPIIQQSNMLALQNGMTMQLLFEQLEIVKLQMTVPIVLMGYLNSVLQYGIEEFCKNARHTGIAGIILPDLPMYEYERSYKSIFKKYGLHFIFLVTPETKTNRIKKADKLSSGFLYAVSTSATTGSNNNSFENLEEYLERLQKMRLKNPVLAGFGIKDKKDFERICKHTDGAIIGSAYIRALLGSKDIKADTCSFIAGIID